MAHRRRLRLGFRTRGVTAACAGCAAAAGVILRSLNPRAFSAGGWSQQPRLEAPLCQGLNGGSLGGGMRRVVAHQLPRRCRLTQEEQESLPALLQQPNNVALWSLARPTILIALLRTTYGVIDSYWVGRLGPQELEAMGASSFAFWVLLLLGEVAALGVHAVAASREGAGKREGVGEAVLQGLWFSVICGLLGLALMPLIPAYFTLLGVESPRVLASGTAYLHGLAWGVVPLTASGVLASGFKGVAVLRPVLIVNAVCVMLNFCLDPVLIWGQFGFPSLGVSGAAVATNICAAVATLLSLQLLRKEGIPLKPEPLNTKTLALIVKIGLPVSLGGLLFTGIYVILGRILSGFGGANIAALGLGHRVEALAFTVCEGFGAAAATLVGQWLGAGHEARAREATRHAARTACWVMLPIAALFLCFARQIVTLFTSDPVTEAAATSYLQIVSLCFPLMGVEHVMDGALAGAGDTMPSFWLGLVLNVARIPLALAFCTSLGVRGVWIAVTLSTVAKAVAKTWAFRRSRLPLLTQKSH